MSFLRNWCPHFLPSCKALELLPSLSSYLFADCFLSVGMWIMLKEMLPIYRTWATSSWNELFHLLGALLPPNPSDSWNWWTNYCTDPTWSAVLRPDIHQKIVRHVAYCPSMTRLSPFISAWAQATYSSNQVGSTFGNGYRFSIIF